MDEAVAVAAERSAQLAADVAALNAEMEQMRSLSRGKLSEGVPPQPAPTAPEPDLASQGFAAVEKLEATIEAAAQWSPTPQQVRRQQEQEEEELGAAEAEQLLGEVVGEFVALVERAASSVRILSHLAGS